MAEYTGNFETGTNGNSVLAADAGSANKWDDVVETADVAITYSNVQAYGTLSAKIVSSATPGGGWVGWTAATLGSSLVELWGRLYIYYTALPSNLSYLIRGFDTGSRAWEAYIASDGTVVIRDNAGTPRGQSTAAVNTAGWTRLEYHVQNSTTAGLIEFKIFNSPDSVTATETVTSTGSFSTLTKTDLLRFGDTQGANPSNTIYLDNILVNDTGYPGPVGVAQPVQILSMQSHVFGHNMW